VGPSALRELYGYHYWANRSLLAVVKQLSPEEFTRTIAGSHGSVRNTLVHALSAEWGWLDRCGGRARGPKLDPESYPTPSKLIDDWQMVEAYVRDFLARLAPDGADRVVEFSFGDETTQRKTVGQLLWHAANHSAHHRGQVALLLRELGYAPGNFDVLFYDPRDE
jgi:uncharacterized damage-inducible protein DinB